MVAKARAIAERHREATKAAIAAGVRVAMGTDSAVGPHGGNLRELALLVECGMTPMQAIEASTRRGAELLGRRDLGTLEPGQTADALVIAGDVLSDIGILRRSGHVRLVMKDGAVVHDGRRARTPAPVAA